MKAYITDYNNNMFWQEMPEFDRGENAMRTVRIYRDRKYQTIRGFGGAFDLWRVSKGYVATETLIWCPPGMIITFR